MIDALKVEGIQQYLGIATTQGQFTAEGIGQEAHWGVGGIRCRPGWLDGMIVTEKTQGPRRENGMQKCKQTGKFHHV